jgi:hypothetical protein
MSDDTVFDTGGVFGANFTSLLVSFVFSDMTVAAAADAATGAAAGVLVGFGMSSNDAVSSTKGADSTLLDLIPVKTNEASAFPPGFFSMILVGLVGLLVGMAMVGLTNISFFIVGKGALHPSPLLGLFGFVFGLFQFP